LIHLVRRFVGFVVARPLSPVEQAEVHDALEPDLRRLFFAQPVPDQRHALDVARRAGGGPERVEAALLHDVGKTGCGLGAVGRSLATLWSFSGLPIWGSWRTYLEHGEIGAQLLETAGASDLTVAFTRQHPGPVPGGVDIDDWRALTAADDV
jgi:hypothetical protein